MISILNDDTMMEPSAYFDEHNCNQSVLHKAHMIEQYQIPNKPTRAQKIQSKKQVECNNKLSQLITKVKNDVNQSIMLNNSKSYMVKHLNNSNSMMYPRQHNITDMTNESAFPNITHEELQVTMSRQYNNGNGVTEEIS